jgi:hypothetical protein
VQDVSALRTVGLHDGMVDEGEWDAFVARIEGWGPWVEWRAGP